MSKINRLFQILGHPKELMLELMKRTATYWPDKIYIKTQYRLILGKSLDLEKPKTLSEKLNWSKLYYHNPDIHSLVEKYEVKKIVSDKIGSEYVIPTLAIWDTIDDIDISQLPNQFVLKCTHDSGSVIICKDKATFDFEHAKKLLRRSYKRQYYYSAREWAYKDIKPRIICEPFIPTLGKKESVEYKITVYNGKVRFVTVCTGIAHTDLSKRTNDHFTPNWERLPFYAYYKPSGQEIPKPSFMDKMIELTEKLADGLPQVRVDWYYNEGKMIFGEMTFYTWAGYLLFNSEEWDEKLGSWLNLPTK